eukprot:4457285-Amphidinium_carterae.1
MGGRRSGIKNGEKSGLRLLGATLEDGHIESIYRRKSITCQPDSIWDVAKPNQAKTQSTWGCNGPLDGLTKFRVTVARSIGVRATVPFSSPIVQGGNPQRFALNNCASCSCSRGKDCDHEDGSQGQAIYHLEEKGSGVTTPLGTQGRVCQLLGLKYTWAPEESP